MANIDQVQLPDGSQYHIIDDTSGYATTTYVQNQISTINKNTIGLGNVDNTADINKPVSLPQQAALNGKVDDDIVAYVESDTTATKRYEVGDQFILNGVLYTATAIIAVNDTIVIGTNCELANSVTEQINSKVSKSGDTMTGNLIINSAKISLEPTTTNPNLFLGKAENLYTAYARMYSNDGHYAQISTGNSYGGDYSFNFPKKGGILAVMSDVAPVNLGSVASSSALATAITNQLSTMSEGYILPCKVDITSSFAPLPNITGIWIGSIQARTSTHGIIQLYNHLGYWYVGFCNAGSMTWRQVVQRDYIAATASGDTLGSLIGRIKSAWNKDKITANSYIVYDTSVYRCSAYSSTAGDIQFTRSRAYSTNAITETIYVANSKLYKMTSTTSGNSITDESGTSVTNGKVMYLYY